MHLFKLSEGTPARRRLLIRCVDATDGNTAEPTLVFAAGELKISKNGGAEANHAGTVTELAAGLYHYEFAAGELDTLGFVSLRVAKTGVREAAFVGQVVAFDPYAAANLGLANLDATVGSRSTYLGGDTAGTTTLLNRLTAPRATALDNLDVAVSSRLATANYTAPPSTADIWSAVNRTLTAFAFTVDTNSPAPSAADVADKLLGRSIAGGADGGRTVRDALRILRNRVTRPPGSGVGTVYQEDDLTAAWTFVVAADPATVPIKEIDPS